MKRNDIVKDLIKEGFSEKTLVRFNDKQLLTLHSSIFEQQQVKGAVIMKKQTTPPIEVKKITDTGVNVELREKEKPHDEDDDKDDVFPTGSSDWNKKKKLKKKETKEAARTMANGYHGGLKKMKYKAGRRDQKCEVDEIKDKFVDTQSNKNHVKFDKTTTKDKFIDVEKKAKNTIKKGVDVSNFGDPVKFQKKQREDRKIDESTEIKEWVEKTIENSYHSLTTKNEIMELITVKLNEQDSKVPKGHNGIPEFMTYDAIKSNEPATKPETKPGTSPTPTIDPGKTEPRKRPKTPYQPGPGPNPKPKAGASKPLGKKI